MVFVDDMKSGDFFLMDETCCRLTRHLIRPRSGLLSSHSTHLRFLCLTSCCPRLSNAAADSDRMPALC
jgi:hypothetical protein